MTKKDHRAILRAVGHYRTVFADLECARCGESYGADVQIVTGADEASPVYAEGDEAPDLAPGARFVGHTDRYCVRCIDRWSDDESKARFEQLAHDAREGAIRIVRMRYPEGDQATREQGVPDPDQPLAPEEIETLGRARKNLIRALGHVWAQLTRGDVALLLRDGTCAHPRPKSAGPIESDPTLAAWKARHDEDVRVRLAARGWPVPVDDPVRSVDVVIDDDRRVHVAR